MKSSTTVAKTPKTPKTPKAPKPTGTHTHRCLGGGGHDWPHANPCDRLGFRTRACDEHPLMKPDEAPQAVTVDEANAAEARLDAEQVAEPVPMPVPEAPAPVIPDAAPAYTVRPIGKMFGVIGPDDQPVQGSPVFKTAVDAQTRADQLAQKAAIKTRADAIAADHLDAIAAAQTVEAPKAPKTPKVVVEHVAARVHAPTPPPPPTAPVQAHGCQRPGCVGATMRRGLCGRDYWIAAHLVMNHETTWDQLVATGKALALKGTPGKGEELAEVEGRRAWFLATSAPAPMGTK